MLLLASKLILINMLIFHNLFLNSCLLGPQNPILLENSVFSCNCEKFTAQLMFTVRGENRSKRKVATRCGRQNFNHPRNAENLGITIQKINKRLISRIIRDIMASLVS